MLIVIQFMLNILAVPFCTKNVQCNSDLRIVTLYHDTQYHDLGCILLGIFWLFLFRFTNNRIHEISISKRTFLHVSDLETESEVT